jgi:hypothetical protein
MGRSPLVAFAAALVVSLTFVALASARPGERPAVGAGSGAAPAAVAWPPSIGLLVGEVVTGAASASDEWVELYNGGAVVADLTGLELVYVTASGSTISRRATWPDATLMAPGGHYLLTNAAGTFAPIADRTYTGGLAATGGSLVLRPVGGDPVDSLSWGEATSAFVEGSPGLAPGSGQSLERSPGGSAGNGRDTNDNLADTFIQSSPVPQALADTPPVPSPTPVPTPTGSPTQARSPRRPWRPPPSTFRPRRRSPRPS